MINKFSRVGNSADCASFTGRRSDYEVKCVSADNYFVKDLRPGNPDGNKMVTEIKSFQFSDQYVDAGDFKSNSSAIFADSFKKGRGRHNDAREISDEADTNAMIDFEDAPVKKGQWSGNVELSSLDGADKFGKWYGHDGGLVEIGSENIYRQGGDRSNLVLEVEADHGESSIYTDMTIQPSDQFSIDFDISARVGRVAGGDSDLNLVLFEVDASGNRIGEIQTLHEFKPSDGDWQSVSVNFPTGLDGNYRLMFESTDANSYGALLDNINITRFDDPVVLEVTGEMAIRETIADGGSIISEGLNSDGIVVASLTVKDGSAEWNGSMHIISDEVGNPVDDSRFEVVGEQIKVRPGAVFDFETEPSIELFVTTINSEGGSFTQSLSFTVGDFEGYYEGTKGADVIKGSSEEDIIVTGAGDDIVDGGNGSDTIIIDDITQKTGNHITDSGSEGVDTVVLSGDTGDSFEIQSDFSAASGIEVIDGSNVDGEVLRTLEGAANFDFTDVEMVGVDAIRGRAKEDDRITGSRGDDHIIGKSGNDILIGGSGNDILDTGNGDDFVDGGDGADTVILDDISTSKGNTIVDSGDDGEIDTVVLSGKDGDSFEIQNDFSAASGIEVIDGSGMEGETLRTIDGAANFDFTGVNLVNVDTIKGTNKDDSITGSEGNDTFELGRGDDKLDGGDGNDDVLVLSGNISEYNISRVGSVYTVDGPDGVKTVQNVESLQFADGTLPIDDLLSHAPTLYASKINLPFGADDINLDNLGLYSIAPQTIGGELSYGEDMGASGPNSGGGDGPDGVIYTDTENGPGFFRYTFNGEEGIDASGALGSYLNFANGLIENPSRHNTPTSSDVILVSTSGEKISVELSYGTYGQTQTDFGEVFQYSIHLEGGSFGTSDESVNHVLSNLEYVDIRVETNYGVTGAESFLTQPDVNYTDHVLTLNESILEATDPVDAPDTLVFTVNEANNGYFASLSDPATAVDTFTQQDINDGLIGFVAQDSFTNPSFSVTVTDSLGDTDTIKVEWDSAVSPDIDLADYGIIDDDGETDVIDFGTDSSEIPDVPAIETLEAAPAPPSLPILDWESGSDVVV